MNARLIETRNAIVANGPFLTALLALIIERVSVIKHFALKYMDEDQAIMWHAASDFASGQFHEPLFYAQDYGTMAESLFAVPFIWLGIHYKFALPIVAALFTLLPFLVLAFKARKHGNQALGVLLLALPVVLPLDYDFITATPRSFTPGALALLPALIWLGVPKLKLGQAFLIHLLFGLCFVLNQSFLILCVPLGLYFLWLHYRQWAYWVGAVLGFGLGAGLCVWAVSYYHAVPHRIIRTVPPLEFSLENLGKCLGNLDRYLGAVVPVAWGFSFVLVALLAVIGYWFIKKKQWPLVAMWGLFMVLLLASFTVNKVQDGFTSITYSYARLFLAMPVALAIFGYFIFREVKFNKYIWGIALVALSFGMVKGHLARGSAYYSINAHVPIMYIWEMEEYELLCNEIRNRATPYIGPGQRTVIIMNNEHIALPFGCNCMVGEFAPILVPGRDRRFWLLAQMDTTHVDHVLVVGDAPLSDSARTVLFPGQQLLPPLPGKGARSVVYVPTRGQRVLDVARQLGITIRPFTPLNQQP